MCESGQAELAFERGEAELAVEGGEAELAVEGGNTALLTRLLNKSSNEGEFLRMCVDIVSCHENAESAEWLFDQLRARNMDGYVLSNAYDNYPYVAVSAWLVAKYFIYDTTFADGTRGFYDPMAHNQWLFVPIETNRADVMTTLLTMPDTAVLYLELLLENKVSLEYLLIGTYNRKDVDSAEVFTLLTGVLESGKYLGG
jgi:hypothetical protein